ncbi:MAG: cohesin domain-containing protein [Melioribacter sp.]|nr:cohesin domain-containing protein [Melioribacter sp.]
MKRYLQILFTLTLLLFTKVTFASFEISLLNDGPVLLVQWKCIPPDSQKVSYQHQNVIGLRETGTTNFRVRSYTGASGPLGPTQRWWPTADGTTGLYWGNETAQVNDRYVQFAVTPKSGYILRADTIKMYLGGGATSFMRVNIAYDTKASFKYPVYLNSQPIALLNNVLTLNSFYINKNVYPGDTLYVRIYPWYTEATLSNTKYLLVQDVRIIGSTTEITASNTPVKFTLPTVSGVKNTEKLADIKVDDVSGKNITSFEFTLNYDKNIVSIRGVSTEGTLLDGKGILTAKPDTVAGKLTVAWAGYPALVGEGTLLKLRVFFKNYGTTNPDLANTLKFNLGIPGANIVQGELKTSAIIVQGGTVSATEGDNIVIPLLTTEITQDQKVLSYDFTATFDKNVIEINNYDLSSTLSEGGTAAVNINNTNGTVTFSLAKGSYFSGSGTLLKLTGKAKKAGKAELTFTSFKFNTGTPTSTAYSALISVAEANVAPTLTLNPNQTAFAVNENETLTITLVGSDPNTGDALTYSYTATPATTGATLVGNTFTWKPNFDQAGAYSVTFKVTDRGGLSATRTVSIVVNNTNRAPQFTVEIPDGQIIPVHNVPVPFEFIYKATDPDNDPLTFRLISGPGEISADGLYSWVPRPSQAGLSFLIIIEVSDGSLKATSSRTVKVSNTVTGLEEEEAGVPKEYALMQNYPNPFNPVTTIRFALPKESHVKLSVYNILGQEVATLVNGNMSAGYHRVEFDASRLNTGMYIYKIEAGEYVSMKKMMYVK